MSAAQTNSFDVAIIGAGPAGCSAALALARAGTTAALFEKAALPRYKTCGGGVLARAFKHLPAETASIVQRPFNSVALNFLSTSMQFVVSREQPMVYMTMRSELDSLLARTAQKAGVKLFDRFSVKQVRPSADFVEIVSEQEVYRAKFLIGADGVHSLTAKAMGWPELTALAPALEHEIHVNSGDFERFSEMPRFDFNVIKSGYAWVFPKREHLSVGILSTRRTCPDLQSKLAEYLQKIGIKHIERVERHGYLIPLAPRAGPLARGRVLLTGDAAGLVDPVTAEGISHAILSGQLAAAAIAEGQFDPAMVAPLYQEKLDRHILGDLRAARVLARVLYHHPKIRNAIFRLNGRKLCEFAATVIMGEASYQVAMKRPSSYFKLLGR
jgi:geranylgeranyl reductase family protein